jgi:hypothetical protein
LLKSLSPDLLFASLACFFPIGLPLVVFAIELGVSSLDDESSRPTTPSIVSLIAFLYLIGPSNPS